MAVLEDNYRYSNQFQREKIQLSPDSIPNAGWLAPFSHGQEQAIPEGRNSVLLKARSTSQSPGLRDSGLGAPGRQQVGTQKPQVPVAMSHPSVAQAARISITSWAAGSPASK